MKRSRQRIRGSVAGSPLGGPALAPGQVTAMVVALALAVVLYPVGAGAASRLIAAVITDPNGTNNAHVDASGNLQVGGTVHVGNSGGRLTLAGQDVTIDASEQANAWLSDFFDTNECSSLEVFVSDPVFDGGVSLFVAPDGTTTTSIVDSSVLSDEIPHLAFAFFVPGTSTPVVAPFAAVQIQVQSGVVTIDKVWLECGP